MREHKFKTVIVRLIFLNFFFFSLSFFIAFNWAQSFLTETYPFEIARRHYLEHIQYLNGSFSHINIHVVLAIIMLITGFVQFSTRLRVRSPRVHRMMGYSYYLVGVLNVSLGLYLSSATLGGLTAQISNYFTGFLWFLFSGISLQKIRNRQFKRHESWAYRSYIIAASTGLIRPVEFLVDQIFPHQSVAILFGVSSWISLILGLLACMAVSDLSKDKSINSN